MKKLEQLPEIAARQLGGLEATPALLAKIKLKAAEERTPRKPAWKSVAALATAFVLLAVGALVLVGAGVTVLVVRLVKKSRNKRKAT